MKGLPSALLFIDSLHCGGSQRQLCYLAQGLKELGHRVAVAIYHPQYDFFKPFLRDRGIEWHELRKRSVWQLTGDLKALVAQRHYEWVISFQENPSVYALLAKIRCGRFRVCVSERAARADGSLTVRQRALRRLYRWADGITANSQFQADVLRRYLPGLAPRIQTISNCVDDAFFNIAPPDPSHSAERIRLGVVGQINRGKNLHGVIDALQTYRQRHGKPPKVCWAGRFGEESEIYCREQQQRIIDLGLENDIELQGSITDVPRFLSDVDALLHPSLFEGFPNAVCEALAAGRPALIGAVSDGPRLVDATRGFLFDPNDPRQIALAMHRFTSLSEMQRDWMSRAARQFAESQFRLTSMAEAFSRLLCEKGSSETPKTENNLASR